MVSGESWLGGPVVVPLDGRRSSLRAMYFAARLAELVEAPLRVLSVVEHAEDEASRSAWVADAIAPSLGDLDADIEILVAHDVAGAIVADVADGALVCMATAGKLSFHSGHFGSIAEGVVRNLDRPVVLVGPAVPAHPASGTRKIVVPVDGSTLSTAAFGPAADLAAVLDVPLWVISVVSPSAIAVTSATHQVPAHARAFDFVPELAKQLAAERDVTVEHEVINSEDPPRAIVDFAGDEGTVVMSTHGRSGLSRVFAGSIAAGVVAHSHRPVAVLRPMAAD